MTTRHLIYATSSAAKIAAGGALGVAAVGISILINPMLLLPLVALGIAATTLALLSRENGELRTKLSDERDRAEQLRRACADVLEMLPEGGRTNFLAAALVASRPTKLRPLPPAGPAVTAEEGARTADATHEDRGSQPPDLAEPNMRWPCDP